MRRLILTLALGSPTAALGAVLVVPVDYPTLADALVAASSGDRIELQTGSYDFEVVIDKNVRIEAPDGHTVTVTNSGTSGQIFDAVAPATSVDIRNIHFEGAGNPDLRAIRSNGVAVVQITDCTADGFTTLGDGAFLEVTDSVIATVTGGSYTNLSAVNGGVFAVKRIDPTMSTSINATNVVIDGAAASGDGGAFYGLLAGITITDTMINNTDAINGGAVYASHDELASADRTVRIQRSFIEGATATELGGGVYADAVTVRIDNSTFLSNSAASGGAIWMDQGARTASFQVNDISLFSDNEATGMGTTVAGMEGIGGSFRVVADTVSLTDATVELSTSVAATAWVDATSVSLTDSMFANNSSANQAGALQAVTPSFSAIGGSVEANTAGTDGGGFYLQSAQVDISNMSFVNNTAVGAGGGLWAVDAMLSLDTALFTDNSADLGGGVYSATTDAPLSVSDSRFYRNTATDGAGLHSTGLNSMTSMRNTWCNNIATGSGGAMHVVGTPAALFSVRNDGASGNTASDGGVYRAVDFDAVDVAFSTYVANEGSTGGAVLDATGLVHTSMLYSTVATEQVGTAFIGTGGVEFLADRPAFRGNTADLGGDWATAVPTAPFMIPDMVPVYTSFPGTSCETISLQPHPSVGSPLLDVGPSSEDRDGSLTDIGLSGGPDADPALFIDGDGDGFANLEDCDDTRADAFPGAVDFCNELDDNCNGVLDEDPDTIWYADLDGDGFGDPLHLLPFHAQCDPPVPNSAGNDLDCDDTAALVHPDAEEICDGIDNNCDTITDDDASDRTSWFRDVDFDGFGDDNDTVLSCDMPDGYVSVDGDCDDTLANVYPGGEERCDTLDNDCNGIVDNDGVNAPRWYPDVDQDGWGAGAAVVSCLPPPDHSPFTGDCDDNDAARAPGNDEICDGIDNDCDEQIDIDPITPTYFPDLDLDGFGDGAATPIGSCAPIAGLVDDGSDCDDSNAAINPDGAESCDGVDEDCDGQIDNNPTNGTVYFLDADSDGFGDTDFEIVACTRPPIAADVGGDCNDDNDVMFPGNTEVCDFYDNNCDGDIDEVGAVDAVLWYQDADNDGYGNADSTVLACNAPVRHVSVAGDCDDTNPIAFPGRLEVCDGVDNDCDGTIDGPESDDVMFYFEDADGDGFGNPDSQLGACQIPEGYVSNSTDCDDDNPLAFPGAQEDFTNNIDEDCDGQAPRNDNTDTDTDPPKDNTCGCSSAASSNPWFLLPLLGALLVRRRSLQSSTLSSGLSIRGSSVSPRR